MKKYLLTAVLLVLALALAACGGTGDDNTLPPETDDPNTPVVCNHNYVEQTEPATCVAAGKVSSVCSLCGDVASTTKIPRLEHVASEVDCQKDTVCTLCGRVLEAATGHIVENAEVITEFTCVTPGKTKGTCTICNATVEKDVPALGHTVGSDIKLVDGKFQTTCTLCLQPVTLEAQTPALSLDFESDDLEAASANDIGLELYAPGTWTMEDVNGSKALKQLKGNNSFYIHIADPEKFQTLGTFVISFDYTVTKEDATGIGSAFSLLDNFYYGNPTSNGSTKWGWYFKVLGDGVNKIATVNAADKLTEENSVSFELNKTYKIQCVVSQTGIGAEVFVDGQYIGNSGNDVTVASLTANNASFRFTDGPNLGHAFDNITISALK